MPGRRVHTVVGAMTGGTVAALRARELGGAEFLAEMIGGVIGGGIGGRFPDWLEPASTPNHRGACHGAVAGGLIATVGLARFSEYQADCRQRAADATRRAASHLPGCPVRQRAEWEAMAWRFGAGLLMGVAVGYLSHLALDATTPKGLPLAV